MKKLTSILMILALCVAALSVTALAADPTLTIETVSARPGDTVTLSASFANSPGLSGFQGRVVYDDDVLELQSAAIGAAYSELSFSFRAETGKFIAYTGGDGVDGDGVLFTLRFKVRDGAANGAAGAVTIDEPVFADKRLDKFDVTVSGGEVNVSASAQPAPTPAATPRATAAPRATTAPGAAATPAPTAALTAAPAAGAAVTETPAAAAGSVSTTAPTAAPLGDGATAAPVEAAASEDGVGPAPAAGAPAAPGAEAARQPAAPGGDSAPDGAADAVPAAENGEPGAQSVAPAANMAGGDVAASPDAPASPAAETAPQPAETGGVSAWIWVAAALAAAAVVIVLVLRGKKRGGQ